MIDAELNAEVEELIDAVGLKAVVAAVAAIAHEKAEHLKVNWQDWPAARDWERRAKELDRIANKLA
jgi:deoxyhypusine synthase